MILGDDDNDDDDNDDDKFEGDKDDKTLDDYGDPVDYDNDDENI